MLKVKDLDVHYGAVQVLRGVSIEVSEGELVALVGANGAGKTTLLMTISGVLRPSSGTIEFIGERIDKLPTYTILGLGITQVPQGRLLFPDMTVSENLELGAYRAKDAGSKKQKMEEIYSYFEVLGKRKNQKASMLSGGEQQMLAIGRALMSSPKLLLLDEASSGLAPLVVQQLMEIISKLNKEGLTVLLVDQNASVALRLADRGYVLETGSLVLSGKASDLARSELVKSAYLGR